MKTVQQKPAVRPLMRTLSWGTWRRSARISGPECGSPTGRSSLPCLAPLWPLTVAGAACWEPGRWCWLRHLLFTSWAEVSGVMAPQPSYSKNPSPWSNMTYEKCQQKNGVVQLEHMVVLKSWFPNMGVGGTLRRQISGMRRWSMRYQRIYFFYTKSCSFFSGFLLRVSFPFIYMHMKPLTRGQWFHMLCFTSQQCWEPLHVRLEKWDCGWKVTDLNPLARWESLSTFLFTQPLSE